MGQVLLREEMVTRTMMNCLFSTENQLQKACLHCPSSSNAIIPSFLLSSTENKHECNSDVSSDTVKENCPHSSSIWKLVPSLCQCLGRLWNIWEVDPCWRKNTPGAGWECSESCLTSCSLVWALSFLSLCHACHCSHACPPERMHPLATVSYNKLFLISVLGHGILSQQWRSCQCIRLSQFIISIQESFPESIFSNFLLVN